ncbi:MAG: hypothetical protein U0P45_12395 [Acidimicrobiales bacterium]
MSADQLAAHLERWRHAALAELERNDPDRHPDTDSEDDTATIVRGFQGRGILRADLTPASLAIVIEAVEARIETWRRTGQLTEDDRTYQELVGAALVDLIADGSVSSRRGQLRPLLIVTATLTALFDRADVPDHERDQWRAEILGGGPIGKAALRRLVEQANVQLVVTDDDGEPLYVGRARRLAAAATAHARRLLARSGGTCEFPGCAASHHRYHAYITWWEDDEIDRHRQPGPDLPEPPPAHPPAGLHRGERTDRPRVEGPRRPPHPPAALPGRGLTAATLRRTTDRHVPAASRWTPFQPECR